MLRALSEIKNIMIVHNVLHHSDLSCKLTLHKVSDLNKNMVHDILTLAGTDGYGCPMTFVTQVSTTILADPEVPHEYYHAFVYMQHSNMERKEQMWNIP